MHSEEKNNDKQKKKSKNKKSSFHLLYVTNKNMNLNNLLNLNLVMSGSMCNLDHE